MTVKALEKLISDAKTKGLRVATKFEAEYLDRMELYKSKRGVGPCFVLALNYPLSDSEIEETEKAYLEWEEVTESKDGEE